MRKTQLAHKTFRIPMDLLAKLGESALRNEVSVSQEIVNRLQLSYESDSAMARTLQIISSDGRELGLRMVRVEETMEAIKDALSGIMNANREQYAGLMAAIIADKSTHERSGKSTPATPDEHRKRMGL